MEPTYSGTADSLAGKARKAKGDIEDAAGGLTGQTGLQALGKIDKAEGTAQDVVGRAERTAGNLGRNVADMVGNARERVQGMVEDADLSAARAAVERHTQANPLRSLLIAGVIGLVVGRFLMPRHRSSVSNRPGGVHA